MKVLVTNHHLVDRAGSELASIEIAGGLVKRGHEVCLFTMRSGALAEYAERQTGLRVLTPADLVELRDFEPDVLHVHHWPTLCRLQSMGISVPWTIGFLGVRPALENPPSALRSPPPWWAVSEEALENVRQIPGWAESSGLLVRNWCPDESMTGSVRPPSLRLRRILVVSHHFPEDLWQGLRTACDSLGARLEKVGLPERSVEVTAELLAEFDAVVTLGRTAILALTVGIPVMVADHHGADGWITPSNVEQLAWRNFSGRTHRIDPSPQQFVEWLSKPPSAAALVTLSIWARQNTSLSRALDIFESLYGQAEDARAEDIFGAWVGVLSEWGPTAPTPDKDSSSEFADPPPPTRGRWLRRKKGG